MNISKTKKWWDLLLLLVAVVVLLALFPLPPQAPIQYYERQSGLLKTEKGEEKGYFKFGGSTVVLLFEKNKIRIDEDLLINTLKGYETVIREGERIGVTMIRPNALR